MIPQQYTELHFWLLGYARPLEHRALQPINPTSLKSRLMLPYELLVVARIMS